MNILRYILSVLSIVIFVTFTFAGNEQRTGQAGASELLINPWVRSSALANADVAGIEGLESVFVNIAGAAHLGNTQLVFSNTNWLSGADIHVNAFGLSQKLGDIGVLSLSVTSMDWGEIVKTTVANPDGDGSTFHPNYTNIGVSYSKEFSNSIFGGVTVRVINESIDNLKATGVSFDAGLQYITGGSEQIKIGVTMKNVGPTMRMNGDGMAVRASIEDGPINTMQNRVAEYELPSLIQMGASYDFKFTGLHTLTFMGAFTANSFTKDQFHAAVRYSFMKIFIVRAGYIYEKEIMSSVERTTVLTGFTGGFSVEIPVKKGSEKTFAVDYSYRDTNPFNGIHSIGIRINL